MNWFCIQRCISPNIQNYRESELELRILVRKNFDFLFTVTLSEKVNKKINKKEDRVLCTASYSYRGNKQENNKTNIDISLKELSSIESLLNPDWNYSLFEYTIENEISTLFPFQHLSEFKHPPSVKSILNSLYSNFQEEDSVAGINIFKGRSLHCGVLYAYHELYEQAIQNMYPHAKYRSIYYVLLEKFEYYSRNKRFPFQVLLNTRSDFFDLFIKTPEGLVLANSYPYPSFENLLYYTLYSLNLFKVDTGNTVLFICGNAKSEDLLEKLENHVSNIEYLPFDSYCLCSI